VNTQFESILESRPSFDTPQVEIEFAIRRRSLAQDPILFWMASDETKKKIESLRESISKLETQKTMAKGNKAKMDSIQRLIDRFEKDIKTLKTL
jgi:hypothetical protein